MKNNRISFARSMMLAVLSSVCITANAADDLLKDVSITGHFDIYYQHSFNNPGMATPIGFRQFDVKHDQFSLASLQVNFSKAPKEGSPMGFTLSLAAGKNQDIINSAEPGGTEPYRYIQQAYVSYLLPKSGATVDLGKFLTWIGYEGIVSAGNDAYSLSDLFFVAQPIYHTGVRVSAPLSSGFTGSAYLVNGWNEVEDSNGAKSYGATLAKSFGKTSVTTSYYGGVEGASTTNGFAVPGQTSVQLGDLIVVHQLTPSLKLALNADYGSANGVSAGDPSGHFSGIAGYVKNQFSPSLAGTLRYETVSDPNGLRTGFDSHLNSITACVEYSVTSNALFRLELRRDTANQNLFESDSGPKDQRTTLTLAHIVKF